MMIEPLANLLGHTDASGALLVALTGSLPAEAFPLLAPDGTVAAPSYSFASEPSTGLYFTGSSTVRLSTGGVNAFIWNATTFFLRSNAAVINFGASDDVAISRLGAAALGVNGSITATSFIGSGAALTGITGATGGISNTVNTNIVADSDNNGSGLIDFTTGLTSKWQITNPGNLVVGTDASVDIGEPLHRPRNVYASGYGVFGDQAASSVVIGRDGSGSFLQASQVASGLGTLIRFPADGVVTLTNIALSGFSRLVFGFNSPIGLSLDMSGGAYIAVKNGDGSAYAPLIASTLSAEAVDATVGLRVGVNPAATGAIRLPNAGYIMARNAANTGDLFALAIIDSALYLGSSAVDVLPGAANAVSLGSAAYPWEAIYCGGALTVGTHVFFGAGAVLESAGMSRLIAPQAGVWMLTNTSNTDFNRLQFGGTTAAFPSWKRVGPGLVSRLADDSANAYVEADSFVATSGFVYLNAAGDIFLRRGAGSPEGVITAAVGALYVDMFGGVNTTLYVKQSGTGNTGWAAK